MDLSRSVSRPQDASLFLFHPSLGTRVIGYNDFKRLNIFRDEFSKFYTIPTIERPSCVVPMTQEIKNIIEWANAELARVPRAEEPGDD